IGLSGVSDWIGDGVTVGVIGLSGVSDWIGDGVTVGVIGLSGVSEKSVRQPAPARTKNEATIKARALCMFTL
ncbi:MAG: hypothetical protein QGI09_10645, partial [Dehalococcoidia bacterium]|nr:hypothetical protein [Dehalococcoidia bacterium]